MRLLIISLIALVTTIISGCGKIGIPAASTGTGSDSTPSASDSQSPSGSSSGSSKSSSGSTKTTITTTSDTGGSSDTEEAVKAGIESQVVCYGAMGDGNSTNITYTLTTFYNGDKHKVCHGEFGGTLQAESTLFIKSGATDTKCIVAIANVKWTVMSETSAVSVAGGITMSCE